MRTKSCGGSNRNVEVERAASDHRRPSRTHCLCASVALSFSLLRLAQKDVHNSASMVRVDSRLQPEAPACLRTQVYVNAFKGDGTEVRSAVGEKLGFIDHKGLKTSSGEDEEQPQSVMTKAKKSENLKTRGYSLHERNKDARSNAHSFVEQKETLLLRKWLWLKY